MHLLQLQKNFLFCWRHHWSNPPPPMSENVSISLTPLPPRVLTSYVNGPLFIRLLYYILKTRSQDWAKIPKKVKSQKTTLFATKRLISILFYKCFQGPEEWRYSWTDSFVTATCFVDWKLERTPDYITFHISYIKIYNIQQKITKIWGFEKLSHKIEVNRMQLDLYYFSLILHHPHAPFFRILAPCWFR